MSADNKPARGHSDLAVLCEAVARLVWGEPSTETASDLRWGTRGSRVVDRAKGVWFDHERGVGGGTLDLVPGATPKERWQWLRDRGVINKASGGARKTKNGGAKPFTIVATYDYTDESGVLLFQVVRLVPKDFRQRRPNGTGDPGRAHVAHVASSLHGVARRVRVLDLGKSWPACPPKGDISDWIEAGNTAEALNALIEGLQEWEPAASAAGRGDGVQDCDAEAKIAALAGLGELAYQKRRVSEARALGITVGALDKLVRNGRAETEKGAAALPHWHMVPWDTAVSGAELLDNIEKVFRRYIVLPKGAAEALALWTLHAWTMDAGDISPFLVLVSPTKRCGKTSVLIILYYVTPRSELASNISASAVFRYIQETRPTLLIDEADTFVRDNEEMRGILNSGHTKAAAHVIRNVEINGEHKPRRFSTWAPKAIATIRALAETLEDRAIVITLQRKPKAAVVARLRKRDNEEFATLRRQAARWAADNFEKLTDPDPDVPEVLNDRAADNWRPLLAIADLAGSQWPKRAREAAPLLTGEGHESSSINVDLLANIKKAFGDKEAMASADLVAALVADAEWPWVEWTRGRPLTQRQLARLLKPFFIIPQTVHIHGSKDAKGYSRIAFEEAWAAYLPGQDASSREFRPSGPSKRPNPDGMGTSCNFRSVQAAAPDGSKNSNLSNSHAGLDAWTDRKPESGARKDSAATETPSDDPDDPGSIPESLRRHRCDHCGGAVGTTRNYDWPGRPDGVWLHSQCEAPWFDSESPSARRAS